MVIASRKGKPYMRRNKSSSLMTSISQPLQQQMGCHQVDLQAMMVMAMDLMTSRREEES